MDEPEAELPPDDAYERVTNPERFLVLHDAALAEIGRLVASYDVVRTDGVDPRSAMYLRDAPAVVLTPAGGGAPITITLSSFPGVAIHAGHAYDFRLPSCGCDACDEQPDDLIERLQEVLVDVAAGGLTETRQRRFGADASTVRLERADRSGFSESEGAVDPTTDGDLPIGITRWPAWKLRRPTF